MLAYLFFLSMAVVIACIKLHVEHLTLPGIVNCAFFCVPGLLQSAGAYGESIDGAI